MESRASDGFVGKVDRQQQLQPSRLGLCAHFGPQDPDVDAKAFMQFSCELLADLPMIDQGIWLKVEVTVLIIIQTSDEPVELTSVKLGSVLGYGTLKTTDKMLAIAIQRK